MAKMWLQCFVCGTLVQGDPRTPPPCPNAANHFRYANRPYVLVPPSGGQSPFRPAPQRRFFRATSLADERHKRFLKLLGWMAAIGIAICCVGYAVRVISIIPALLNGSYTPTTITTPTPELITGATLGGTQAAFQAKFGSPSGTGTARFYPFSQGRVNVIFAATPSSDGQDHAISLRIEPASGRWNEATALPICAGFLPTDATFVREQQVAGQGSERIYTSAALAATLPASAFNGAAPGTLAMEFSSASSANRGCLLVTTENVSL